MSVIHKIETYKNYGRVLSVTNGAAEFKVTLDIGPRVIYCGRRGGCNVMLNDDERKIDKGLGDPRYEAVFGKGSCWHILGGHRIWTSPEDYPLSYTPDDDAVEWERKGNMFIFTTPVKRGTEFRYIMRLEIDPRRPVITVDNIIENHSGGPRVCAPWSLTVLAPGGLEIIPQPRDQYEFLSNRSLVLWPYTDMTDKRVYWGKDFITLKSVAGEDVPPFKLGLNNTAGAAAYINNGTAFIKTYVHNKKGAYPDRGVSFETYTNGNFTEIETVGEVRELLPGESSRCTEKWILRRCMRSPSPKNEASLWKVTDRLFK